MHPNPYQYQPQNQQRANRSSRRRSYWLRFGLIGAVSLAGSGYAIYQDHRDIKSASCPVEGAETLTLDSKDGKEPIIGIPVVSDGWKAYKVDDLKAYDPTLNDPTVRGVIANTDIQRGGFTPYIVVSLEKRPDATSGNAVNQEKVRDSGTDVLGARYTHDSCGITVYQNDFTTAAGSDSPVKAGTLFLTTTEAADGGLWVVTATLQTHDPDIPGYIAEKEALAKGLHLQPVK